MGCVQSYFKRAHNAGISPSSTQESNSKQPVSEDGTRPVQEERSITEEPESNDTSYGVEATAVRTLAATTGTVAILGTTAKTGDKKGDDGEDRKSSNSATPVVVETIPEEQEEMTVDVEKAVVHEEDKPDTSRVEDSRVESKGSESESKEEPSSKSESRSNSRPNNVEGISENNVTNVEIEKDTPSSASNEVKEDTSISTSPIENNKSPVSDSNKSETVSPNAKSPLIKTEDSDSKKDVETLEPLGSESSKDKEEDASKSISSERLKTNSISNTTLSSDSIVEFDNSSVKQSPSTDKVIESFDSSSTVEFVDTAIKEVLKQEGNKSNPARSVSSDLSVKSNLPLDAEKTPGILSPDEKENNITDEELPPPPPPLEEEEVLEAPTLNDNVKSAQNDVLNSNVVSIESQNEGDSSLKDNTHNDETSLDSEISSNLTNSIQTVASNVQEISPKSAVENSFSNASEDNNKAESGSPLSSDNNSSLNDNEETAPSPITAVSLTPAPVSLVSEEEGSGRTSQNQNDEVKSEKTESSPQILESTKDGENVIKDNEKVDENILEDVRLQKTESIGSGSIESNPKLTNGLSSRSETPNNHEVENSLKESVIKSSSVDTKNSLEKVVNGLTESTPDKNITENAFGAPIDLADEKVVAAATTIQASFRGFHTRQNLKTGGKDTEELLESNTRKENSFEKSNATEELSPKISETVVKTDPPESILENVDDKMVNAATRIQANVRGFLTRQTLKSNVDSGLAPSEETNQSVESRTPTALTPELIESVKEEVNDICKEAEAIAAERSESVEGMLRGVQHVIVGTKESALPSVSDSILAVRGSATPPSVDTDEAKEEVFDSLTDIDDKTIDAATTIQATFRGYQARKALQDNSEQPDSMPDYPPPDECLDDLPPPDFEALESSYSEDVPTEPLVPPPPPDSEIFNEEDEDELAALQRPQECDELPENRLSLTSPSDSSLSSAATKIQAGVRGYLTRKQIQTQGGTGTGTTSTSTNRTAADSDGSLSVDGMRSAISTEEESEVTRHRATPDPDSDPPRPGRSATKRMSLAEPPSRSHAPIRSRALSVQVTGPGPVVSDEEVWNTLKNEMADAATKIQSNFRGYRARKQLQREDAVQGTSSSSQATPTPTSGSVEAPPSQTEQQRASGEYHDIIALTPPNVDNPPPPGGSGSGGEPVADQPADGMVKRRASEDEAGAAAAATKIQATFRGFKTRQEMKDVDRAAAKIQAGFRGYKVRKEMKRNSESGVRRTSGSTPAEGAESLQDLQQTEKAATKIQAGVRGFLVRRRVQRGKDQQ